MKVRRLEIFGEEHTQIWSRAMIVHAQWVPFDKDHVYNEIVAKWFQKINDAGP